MTSDLPPPQICSSLFHFDADQMWRNYQTALLLLSSPPLLQPLLLFSFFPLFISSSLSSSPSFLSPSPPASPSFLSSVSGMLVNPDLMLFSSSLRSPASAIKVPHNFLFVMTLLHLLASSVCVCVRACLRFCPPHPGVWLLFMLATADTAGRW